MMRQAAQQLLSKTRRTSKAKPLWVTNVIRSTSSPGICTIPNPCSSQSQSQSQVQMGTKLWSLTQQFQMARRFSTNTASPVEFAVRSSGPELVGPAKPTPREVKPVSDVDDQVFLRCLVPVVQLYRYDPSMQGKDPAKVIREAIAEALVFYYPLAGRLREGLNEKPSVDCTGEGISFVEADADIELDQLGDPSLPPFLWFDKLLRNVPATGGIFDSPLMFIQVTRLKCGSFIVALRSNHVVCDGFGIVQFLSAVGQIARGACGPSIAPVWNRELLSTAKDRDGYPLQLQAQELSKMVVPNNFKPDLSQRSFFLAPSTVLGIRSLFPEHMRVSSTSFDLLTACLWRCRIAALQLHDQDSTVHLSCVINARSKTNSTIPVGYYGNGFTTPAVETTARKLCESSMEHALSLVKKAKQKGIEEYMGWPTVPHRPMSFIEHLFAVSDVRRAGFDEVDFGWGKPTYSGPPKLDVDGLAFYLPSKNRRGEEGTLISICLQAQVMDKFETEINNIMSLGST